MKLDEVDLDDNPVVHLPSPERCIYCGSADALTDEHIIPYALAANTIILDKSCCQRCQKIIQPYEQAVLKHQLGEFRAQVGAPTRRRQHSTNDVTISFVEVDGSGRVIRDLGIRHVPFDEAPLALNLWASPPPRLLLPADVAAPGPGRAWSFVEHTRADPIARKVAAEHGARHVAMKLGEVSRRHYLRFLAKTAHAFAAAKIGLDAFEPVLRDLILNRSDDLERFVGDEPGSAPIAVDRAATFHIALGEVLDGPGKGYVGVSIRFYPSLGTPAHVVIVGKATADTGGLLGQAIAG